MMMITKFLKYGTVQQAGTLGSRSPRDISGVDLKDAQGIFDELDKALELSQHRCERAAHLFLRYGNCRIAIESIVRLLADVKEKAEKEIERLEEENGRRYEMLKPGE